MSDPLASLRDFDDPGKRDQEVAEWLGMTAGTFSGAVQGSIRHALAAPEDPQARGWTPLGPRNVGGAVRSLAQHPARRSTFYAGAAQGGIWQSDNDGYTWRPIGPPELMLPIGALALAPSNADVIYVGTGELAYGTVSGRGLYRSLDGGQHFTQLAGNATDGGNGAADHYGKIRVDPGDPRRAWVASDTGLWRVNPDGSITQEPLASGLGQQVTDVALARDPADARRLVLLAGVFGQGIERGVFQRGAGGPIAWAAVGGGPAAGSIGRVLVEFSGTLPVVAPQPFAYAVAEDRGFNATILGAGFNTQFPTVVFHSSDFGATFPARAAATLPETPGPNPPLSPGQAWYSLALAVDPSDPRTVLVGYVDLHMSTDRGLTFANVLDWRLYDFGDRAQHADIHAVRFDLRTPRQVWVANDGGVSMTTDVRTLNPVPPVGADWVVANDGPLPTPKPRWRKRSFSITAAQFFDLTTHPVFPFVVGGGMQDNGTFVSVGGPTWYRLRGADGGALAFDPNNTGRFYPTTQNTVAHTVLAAAGAPPHPRNSAPLPDLGAAGAMIPTRVFLPNMIFPAANRAPFVGVVEGDPAVSDRLLIGRRNGGFSFTLAGGVVGTNLPGLGGDISAAQIGAAGADLWFGSTTGQVYTTTVVPPALPAAATAWNTVTPPGLVGAAAPIAGIAIHPANPAVVAVSTMGARGRVFLSHDRGVNWVEITGAAPLDLPPSPVTSVAFDPANGQVLFAGTLAGVYVARDLPAPPAAPATAALVAGLVPTWRTYNRGLPLVQVNDLAVTPVASTLRCGTFGRGAWECDIAGATPAGFTIPDVYLLIRDHVTDDGRVYAPPNVFFWDPRLPQPPLPGPAAPTVTSAYDIRVDAPGFIRSEAFRFGDAIDGAEFDETLVPDTPLAGDTNVVYVQVHNRGGRDATNVTVHLFFADAGPLPGAAPPIAAGLNFPNDPQPGSAWQRAAPVQTIGTIRPGEPAVARFEWIPPLALQTTVALLAVCTNGQDQLAAIPAGAAVAFVQAERRAALRIMPIRRDATYVRDGIDDDGSRGAVAWGGKTPDIIVVAAPVANPDDPAGDFGDLFNPRTTDVVRPGNNTIYVRISNRTETPADANVQVFVAPVDRLAQGSQWTAVAPPVAVAGIPARGWRFATIPWAAPDPDPAAASGDKRFTLVALVQGTAGGANLEDFPDRATVDSADAFWQFAARGAQSNSVAVRCLRFVSP